MRYVVAGLIAALAAVVAAGSVGAGATTVGFSPQTAKAGAGAAVAVDVTVANVAPDPGLGGYDLVLTFDPSVVRLDSLTDSGFATRGENLVVCVTGEIDNRAGRVNATCEPIQLFGAPGVSTTGATPLLHASFTALAPGASPLALSGNLLAPDGATLQASFEAGAVEVTASASPAGETPGSQPFATGPAPQLPTTGSGGEEARQFWPILPAAIATGAAGCLLFLLLHRKRHHRT